MGNIISYEKFPGAFIQLSNNRTDRIYSILLIHGSSIAKDIYEKKMVLWFAMLDQSIRGRGVVGFDLLDMPWDKEHLEKQIFFWDMWLSKCKQDHCTNILEIDGDFEGVNAIFEDLRMWGINLSLEILFNKHQLISNKNPYTLVFEELWEVLLLQKNPFLYSVCHKIIEANNGCYICNNYPDIK